MHTFSSVRRALCATLFLSITACTTTPNTPIPNGTYWSPEYDAYLQVDDAVIQRYQYSPSYCFSASAGLIPKVQANNGGAVGQHRWALQPNGDLTLTRLSDGISVVFHQAEVLPSACGRQTVDTATANLQVLFELLQQVGQLPPREQYIPLMQRANELDSIVYNSEVSYRLSTFVLLAQALQLTQDPHGYLYDRQLQQLAYAAPLTPEQRATPSINAYRQKLSGINPSGWACNEMLWHGPAQSDMPEAKAHRIVVFSFSGLSDKGYGPSQHACMKRFLTNVSEQLLPQAPLQQLFINLAYNAGGSLLLASQLQNTLLSGGQPIAVIKGQPIQYPTPSTLAGLYQQLVIEVSGETASAAEYLAQSLYQQLPNTIVRGGPTRGALSTTRVKALPNGTILQLSNL